MSILFRAVAKLIVASTILVGGTVFAQSAAQLPHLQLSYGGNVNAIAVMPDGGTLLGGSFSTVNGMPRSNLARLGPDGTLDLAWHADTDWGISSIAVGGDGALFVGGGFFHIGGFSRYNIAKLDAFGNVDPSWDPQGSGTGVIALALDNTGYLYVSGGQFPTGSGVTRGLAKIATATGRVDPHWDPAGTYNTFWVYTLQADNNGAIYTGGYFTNIGGLRRNNLARLSTGGVGAADPTWNPGVNSAVNALQLDAAGNIFIGGDFDAAGGLYRFGLAKLSTSGTGAADPDWDPVAGGFMRCYAMRLNGHGSIYIGGDFGYVSGVTRANIAKLSTSGVGTADSAWNPGTQGRVRSIAVAPTGTVMAGGEFITLGDLGRVGYGAVTSNGVILPAANAGSGRGMATAIATQSDGGVIVGGNFQLANGIARQNLARIAPSGEVDPLWDPGHDSIWRSNKVYALATDANSDIYVSGTFTALGGRSRLGLAKIAGSASGVADADWNPAADPSYPVDALALAVDGDSVFVGGIFYAIGGQPRSFLAKLAAGGTGAADSTWNPAPDNGVRTLAVGANHILYVGGDFTNVGTATRRYLARLSGIGTAVVDPMWNPDADAPVLSIQLDSAQAPYVAGNFSNIGGRPLPSVAKLTSNDGSADPNWITPTQSAYLEVIALANGKLYAGGRFASIQGLPSSNLARLDTATGVVDPEWLPQLRNEEDEPNDEVFAIAPAADGSVYIGGNFTQIDGDERTGFARFAPDEIFGNGFD